MTKSNDNRLGITKADALAIDRLATDGFNSDLVQSLEGDERARGEAAVSLLSLLDLYPAEELSDEDEQTLVDATMARIGRAEDDRRDRMKMDNQPVMLGRGLRFRIAEGLAVAAVLAMAAATLWSFGTSASSNGFSAMTHRNLGELHAGLSGFQDANDGGMPLRATSPSVANLLGDHNAQLLDLDAVASQGHCTIESMRNPRRPADGHQGFSYTTLSVNQRPLLGDARVILIGDRNPALAGMLSGQKYAAAMAGSSTHPRLTARPSALFADGHIEDLGNAACEGDCIWSIDPAVEPAPIEIFLAH